MMTTLFVGAPQGVTWPLGLEQFEAALHSRWPAAQTFAKHDSVTDRGYLAFQVDLDDMCRHGGYVDGSQIFLQDGDPEFWADTIVWFLRLLPTDAQAVALVEVNPEYTAPIPPGASAEEIRSLLDGLAQAE